MISLSPFVLEELGASGEVVGTHIRVRAVYGTRAKYLGAFDTVAEALSKCSPDNALDFLRANKMPVEEAEKEGMMLCHVYHSPAQLSHETVG